MLREIKGGTGAGSLFAAGVAPDYERLEKNPRFKEAAERLGYRFQPAVMRLRGQLERDLPGLTDPWVRWVHEEALGSGPDGERALSLLQQLGPARKERSAVLDGLLRSGGIRSGRAERVVQSEIPATGGSLEIRVFRALFMAVRVSGSTGLVALALMIAGVAWAIMQLGVMFLPNILWLGFAIMFLAGLVGFIVLAILMALLSMQDAAMRG
jgi:hypothetical protein